MRDLTQHLTARADDSHAAPEHAGIATSLGFHPSTTCMSNLGKVLRVVELNHMLHRLCGPPSIPLSFNLAAVLPRRDTQCVSCGTGGNPPTLSIHSLGRGLPGYLILFAPHAFVSQRQVCSRAPPSPPAFLPISTHFTATPGIPRSSPNSSLAVPSALFGLGPKL